MSKEENNGRRFNKSNVTVQTGKDWLGCKRWTGALWTQGDCGAAGGTKLPDRALEL